MELLLTSVVHSGSLIKPRSERTHWVSALTTVVIDGRQVVPCGPSYRSYNCLSVPREDGFL